MNVPMPDPRSVMKEFRFLDQKRQAEGLTADEEVRLAELRDLVGVETTGVAQARPGFDVSAAAARLRESLLPAGLRNRPPPAPEPSPEPIGEIEPPVEEPQAVEAAYAEQPSAPLEETPSETFFDPGALAAEAEAYDPNAAAYDPNAAAYDPNAAAYDPNAAPYDPNAAAYDPNAAPYDPNAAPYDPNAAPYDPNAAPYDPNAAAYDPNAAPYDPNAAAYDPNAAAYDPNAAAYDPNAAPYDPNAAAYDPNAAAYDPNAAPVDAAAPTESSVDLAFDPNAPVSDPNTMGWADATPPEPAPSVEPETVDLAAEAAGLPDSASETDWSAVSAEVSTPSEAQPEEAPEAWAPVPGGDYDAAAWDAGAAAAAPAVEGEAVPEPVAAAPADDLSPFPAAGWSGEEPAVSAAGPAEFGSYDESAAPPAAGAPTELESLLPFDPAAEAAVGPDMARAFEGQAPELELPAEPTDVPDAGAFHAAEGLTTQEAPGWQPEPAAVDQGFALASGGSFDASVDAAAPEWAAPAPAAASPWEAPATGEDLAGGEPYAGAPAAAASLDYSGGELTSDADTTWSGAAAAGPASPPEPDAFEVHEALEAAPLPALDFEVGTDDMAAEAPAPADAPPLAELVPGPVEDDIPTIEATDVVDAEPLPEPAPAPLVAAEPEQPAEPPLDVIEPAPEPEPELVPALPVDDHHVHGSYRVVVHTVEGQVKRGVLEDADLEAPELALAASPGGPTEGISTRHVKAIFFMLAPGEQPVTPYGSRVRVTFRDGRQVAGLSPDYREGASGFFMIPADARTSTARIWVYSAAVKQVAVS
jgi:hypothetical protein